MGRTLTLLTISVHTRLLELLQLYLDDYCEYITVTLSSFRMPGSAHWRSDSGDRKRARVGRENANPCRRGAISLLLYTLFTRDYVRGRSKRK